MLQKAVCNPALTYSVSSWQTACGVADILSHLMEQYLYCDNGCTVSDEMLLGLMRSVVLWGPVAVREPDNFDARSNLMLASSLAMNGLVGSGHDQNWVSHCMEHAVSAVWPNVAHGAGMACILPAYLKLIAPQDAPLDSHPVPLTLRVAFVKGPCGEELEFFKATVRE